MDTNSRLNILENRMMAAQGYIEKLEKVMIAVAIGSIILGCITLSLCVFIGLNGL